jgi:periplasmic nitrate reductase NapD
MREPMQHISSAVLRVSPAATDEVSGVVTALGVEVALSCPGRIVVLIEGPTSGAVGEVLTRLALLDGVHSACMVYEQAEPLSTMGDEQCL